jgi:hypothetical protein
VERMSLSLFLLLPVSVLSTFGFEGSFNKGVLTFVSLLWS